MLQQIRLVNFKAFQRFTINARRITLLIGPNGTGKSSVLQACGLLKQSVNAPNLVVDEGYVTANTVSDLIHTRARPREMTLGLKLAFLEEAIEPLSSTPEWELDYEIAIDDEGLKEQQVTVRIPGFQVLRFATPRQPAAWKLDPEVIRVPERPDVRIFGSYLIGFPFQHKVQGIDKQLHDAMQKLRFTVVNYLNALAIVPVQRVLTEDRYPVLDPKEARKKIEDVTTAQELMNFLSYRRDVQEEVSDVLSQLVGRGVQCTLVNGFIEVRGTVPGRSLPMAQEGAGTRQLVWPLTTLLAASREATVTIEEPELHLHPRAQAKLCDVLMDIAVQQEKQLFLTSHSEHIMRGVLTGVAEGNLRPDDLAIWYLDEAKGFATGTPLEVDEKGRVKGGMKGFFEVDIEQLDRYLQATRASG